MTDDHFISAMHRQFHIKLILKKVYPNFYKIHTIFKMPYSLTEQQAISDSYAMKFGPDRPMPIVDYDVIVEKIHSESGYDYVRDCSFCLKHYGTASHSITEFTKWEVSAGRYQVVYYQSKCLQSTKYAVAKARAKKAAALLAEQQAAAPNPTTPNPTTPMVNNSEITILVQAVLKEIVAEMRTEMRAEIRALRGNAAANGDLLYEMSTR